MHEYVRQQTAILLRRLAYQVNRAEKNADEEAIHDLRVAIRRFRRCLQIFAQFYPGNSWKKVRRRLSEIMDAAGDVRDRDIAAGLLVKAGVPVADAAFKHLGAGRRAAVKDLVYELRLWKDANSFKRWRRELGL
jgi:CHAD domain-containing protein